MTKLTLLHNARCSKSRIGLAYLQDADVTFTTVEYLKTPLSKEELLSVIEKLGGDPLKAGMIRTNEADFKANFKGKELTNDAWAQAMLDYPKLMERPILISDDKAVVGRPAEAFDELI